MAGARSAARTLLAGKSKLGDLSRPDLNWCAHLQFNCNSKKLPTLGHVLVNKQKGEYLPVRSSGKQRFRFP
jgi:hypothetical protein